MPSLMFCVPVHGRLQLASICLRQLRRTCQSLTNEGVSASAVIVGDASDLRALNPFRLGFSFVRRSNDELGRKFNDAIQLATDPRYNHSPADYVVPCGSDDWVDHRLFLELPGPDTMVGFQQMSFVREDGRQISSTYLKYEGGAGIRIIPRQLVEPLDYRPADDYRTSGCDTSILRNLRLYHGDKLHVEHRPPLHDRQIVDWKNPTTQLNRFDAVTRMYRSTYTGNRDPFIELADYYPRDALEEMRSYYDSLQMVAA